MNDWPTFATYDAHFVAPYLAVGAYPRPEHMPEIEAAGIRGILNVVAGAGPEAFAYVAHVPSTIHWRHCGFWDGYFGSPEPGANQILCPSYARMVTIEAALMLRDHSPMLLHCAGGSGRSGNVAAILVAAREGIGIDEASARMQQHRKVIARFFREGFWKHTPDEELVGLAKAVLSEVETPRAVYCARIRGDVNPAEPTFERIVG
jgi:hypothetical protein